MENVSLTFLSPAINSGGQPITLYAFKSRGTFTDDDIITGEDKTTIE